MNLQELFTKMETYLRSAGYADSTIEATKHSWHQFSLYCEEKGVTKYNFAVAAEFAKEHYGVDFYKLETPHSGQECNIFRIFKSLDEFQSDMPITIYRKQPVIKIPDSFAEIIQLYLAEYGKKVQKSSLDDARYTLVKFAEYLTKEKVDDLHLIRVYLKTASCTKARNKE